MKYAFIFLFLLLTVGCSENDPVRVEGQTIIEWNAYFVVWEGNMYIITDESVQDVTNQIGSVMKYSDNEVSYGVVFSNKLPAGTRLYEIKGVDESIAIAARVNNGKYIKLTYNGKFGK